MGLLHGLLEDDRKFPRAYQANAISAMTCGLFGTSPTVSTVESAAGITAGGKTGLTSIVTEGCYSLHHCLHFRLSN